ncbi:MAG: hypothetical protein C0478_05800 [Planctomyces sp.]|nr:hypothetical protein [Planctomyces sp.]
MFAHQLSRRILSRRILCGLCLFAVGSWAVSPVVISPVAAAEKAKVSSPRVAQASAAQARVVSPSEKPAIEATSRLLDQLLQREFDKQGVTPAALCSDEDFLRRATMDIAGRLPTPAEIRSFTADTDPAKRRQLIDTLLAEPAYATNWARYWRDVFFMNATNARARFAVKSFEEWMTAELDRNASWGEIVTQLITAKGDVYEDGSTALFFVHDAEPEEVASEISRVFMGTQMSCANCHDHPSDIWKRRQFHELAAFLPRVSLKQDLQAMPPKFELVSVNENQRRGEDFLKQNPEMIFQALDRNRDRKIDAEEAKGGRGQFARVFPRVIEYGDTNKDGMISLAEIKSIQIPARPGQGTIEYYMPNLDKPSEKGTLIQPKFFVNGRAPGKELSDEERRESLAQLVTSPENPWFAKAVVNRVWHEMLGSAFYMPVDDMGPSRSPQHPAVIEALSEAFTASGYDLKWLVSTIAHTEAYQRSLRNSSTSQPEPAFAAAQPSRWRADQLFSAMSSALGIPEETRMSQAPGMMGRLAQRNSPRGQFAQLFGFDPSMPREDITGTIPQTLMLMNSPTVNRAIDGTIRGGSEDSGARAGGPLAFAFNRFPANRAATEPGVALNRASVTDLYLKTLARKPTEAEFKIVKAYVTEGGNNPDAAADLLWALINSTEFLSRR